MKIRFLSVKWPAIPLLAICFLASPARAGIVYFHADELEGSQEVPPNASTATGAAELTLDQSTGLVTVIYGFYENLLGSSTAVTLNDGEPGSNGPVLLTFTLTSPGSTTGAFSGSDLGPLTSQEMIDMVYGNTYINVESSIFPGGELRGQLINATPTPEPTSLALMGLGLAGSLIFRRCRGS